jgi:alcohol dehydrogenase class IV
LLLVILLSSLPTHFLPYTIEYNAAESPARYADIANFLHLPCADSLEGVHSLVDAIRKLAADLDQPRSLRDFGISRAEFENQLPLMVENALSSVELLANPRQPSTTDIENLFIYAFEGKLIDF